MIFYVHVFRIFDYTCVCLLTAFLLSRRCSFFSYSLPPYSSALSSLALFVCSLFRVSFVFVFAFRVAYWRFYLFSVFCAFSYMLKILEFIFFFSFFFAQNLFQFSLVFYFVFFFMSCLRICMPESLADFPLSLSLYAPLWVSLCVTVWLCCLFSLTSLCVYNSNSVCLCVCVCSYV